MSNNLDTVNSNNRTMKVCKFYLEKKKRKCKCHARPNSDYCGEHSIHNIINQSLDSDLRRIFCPFDNKHTCLAKYLDDHLKKCNARPRVPKPYFKKGINRKSSSNVNTIERNLSELTLEEFESLLSLIKYIHSEIVLKENTQNGIPNEFGYHPVLGSEILRTDAGNSAIKHITQIASILSIIEKNNMFQNSTCFMEFGSGKGGLTYWLGQVIKKAEREECRYYPLDRKGNRYKKDNKLITQGMHVDRIRIDIEDLKLDQLDGVQKANNIVGTTKHLCGAGTDLALRCLLETNDSVLKVSGLVFATCCHHVCTLDSYVGLEYLKNWGVKPELFKAFTALAGWAICGTGESRFDGEDDDSDNPEEKEKRQRKNSYSNFRRSEMASTIADRRQFGIMMKQILDFGRVLYIRNLGLKSYLCYYTDLSATLENLAIVAHR